MANPPTQSAVYFVPAPPPPTQSILPIADGKPATAVNIGGIVVGPSTIANQVFQAPSMPVPLGLFVRARGNPTNAGEAILALLREDALNGRGDPVNANTEIDYPIDNLGKLFVRLGTIGDAVTLSVRSS
jgi:hypothetical protein